MTAAAPAAMISAPEQTNVGAHGSQMLHGGHAPPASGASLPLTLQCPGRATAQARTGLARARTVNPRVEFRISPRAHPWADARDGCQGARYRHEQHQRI